ncbi:signal peptidase I Serine peptidase. MEROPS family S26A [Agrococcus baldri]|uniref:Signal peptidase I n=1 Tax=Agrococcus baldri TaxID=153730 RepID=A0AA94HM17_9MICO|nr:signal peptidase I [Agrococcus baldri]SFS09388.1 signal peptidase I Serine peptidase. MEROPS family S26A [Agrococcus baldri]
MGRRTLSTSTPVRITAAVLLGAVAVVGLRLWVMEPLTVSSDSMEPTVMQGSTVLVSRWQPPPVGADPGQLVVFRSPEDGHSMLKRVVAVAGQTVAVQDGVLYVDGVAVREPYVDHGHVDGTFFGRLRVPADHVFVLGDNREFSTDSRDFGPVPLEAVIGAVLWTG